jgi:hypothetical protein
MSGYRPAWFSPLEPWEVTGKDSQPSWVLPWGLHLAPELAPRRLLGLRALALGTAIFMTLFDSELTPLKYPSHPWNLPTRLLSKPTGLLACPLAL